MLGPTARIKILAVFVIVLALLFLAKLFFLQVVRGEYYNNLADRQYLNPASRVFNRGSIFFQTKAGDLVSAATVDRGFLLSINPKLITNADQAAEKIAAVFPDLKRADFLAKAAKKTDPYEEITDHLPQSTADKIKAQKIAGVYLYKDAWRSYPAKQLASHVVGFMGYRSEAVPYTGLYGLERQYNDVLERANTGSFANFFAEIFSGLAPVADKKNNAGGEGDIVLTIEPNVQNFFESQLTAVKEKYHADSAGGVVIDPKTGRIIAMAQLPNFNPGEKQNDLGLLNDPIVSDVYELGSIFKPLTMAAGLDAGVVTAQTTYFDKGFLILNNKRISNYDGKGRGLITMQEVLNQSLNTGATFVSQQLGPDRFRQYFLNYGLGQKTGIDLPDEVQGIVRNLDSKRPVEMATASFGQGIAVSPIEMVRALAVLANGGVLVKPYVVDKIKYQTTLEKKTEPQIGPRVLKPETSREISRMLTQVVDDKLANGKAKQEHFSVAAKTGTAQMVDPATKKYYPDRYLHSFFGYFPSYDARFLVFIYIVYPKDVQYASETLTEPFLNVTKYLLNYYSIPPDR